VDDDDPLGHAVDGGKGDVELDREVTDGSLGPLGQGRSQEIWPMGSLIVNLV
jgi:hypothetical protein